MHFEEITGIRHNNPVPLKKQGVYTKYMEKQIPILYHKKLECCGCGACMNICPRNAITMKEDECGFIYPTIDYNMCVKCGRCKTVCAFQNTDEVNTPLKSVAAVSNNKEQAHKSASGGIFAAIASVVLNEGGLVFGAAFTESWNVEHRCISDIKDLFMLQGSKYVQSSTLTTFSQAQEALKQGRKVLYSGTPCQIAGLKKYLGKYYEELLTVDIICHGVPNTKIFQSYIKYMEQKYKRHLKYFTFRDKNIGWGINGKALFENSYGKKQSKILWQSGSSYLFYFIKGWIYRENCYQCKYAGKHRPGDITLGDYWGIERQHPEYLNSNGWDESKGISVMIANTEKGQNLMDRLDCIEMKPSTFEKAAHANGQLNHPSSIGKREEIMSIYREGGWDALESRYQKEIGIRKYSSQIKSIIPRGIKRWIKSRL